MNCVGCVARVVVSRACVYICTYIAGQAPSVPVVQLLQPDDSHWPVVDVKPYYNNAVYNGIGTHFCKNPENVPKP